MPKFTIEIDTDSKTSKVLVDDKEVDCKEFSATQYTYSKYADDGKSETQKTCTYLSLTKDDGDGIKTSYGISFDTDGSHSQTYSINNYNVAKETAQIHKNAIQATKLANVVATRKPVVTIDFTRWNPEPERKMMKEPTFMG